jgi:branched-chain amino acid transport system ATP-binding protein
VPTERKPLIDLLATLRSEGVTLLFIEHIMAAVMTLSDRVLVLHEGTPLAEGTPHEVTSNPRVVQAYLGEESQIAES